MLKGTRGPGPWRSGAHKHQGARGPRGAQGGPGGPGGAPGAQKGGEGSGSSWPGGLGVPPPKRPAPG